MIKIKDICDVDTKPNNYNCDSHNNENHILCVQRNSKSAGNTFYYNNNDIINTNVYYLNNIKKDYNVSSLYILISLLIITLITSNSSINITGLVFGVDN
jgi:hypothetical protein